MKFIIATKNEHKLKEFKRILNPHGIEVISQAEAGADIDVNENADTFEGNSYLKAKAIYDKTKIPTIADDSGLEVYALDNAPGVYSARYGGDSCKTDADRTNLLLKNMENIPDENRGARFVCAITLVISEDKHYSFMGYCDGKIGYSPKGENGFGYDPVFMIGDKSISEISPAEKDSISHRGRALVEMEKKLNEIRYEVEK